MKASEYVAALQKLIQAEGDLEILTRDPYRTLGAYRNVSPPEVAYKAIPTKRERTPRFHGYSSDSEDTRGEKVIRV